MKMIMGALAEVEVATKSPPSPLKDNSEGKAESSSSSEQEKMAFENSASSAKRGEAAAAAAAVVDPSIYDDPPVPLPQCSPELPRRAARRPPTAVKDNAVTRAVEAEVEKERRRRGKLQAPSSNSQIPMASLQLFLFALCGLLYSVACRACGGGALWASLPGACEMASYRPILLLALPTMVVIELVTALVTVVGGAAKRPCTPGAAPAQLPGGLQNNMIVNMLLSSSPTGAAVKESLANAMVLMAYMSHIRFCVSVGVFSLIVTHSMLAIAGN